MNEPICGLCGHSVYAGCHNAGDCPDECRPRSPACIGAACPGDCADKCRSEKPAHGSDKDGAFYRVVVSDETGHAPLGFAAGLNFLVYAPATGPGLEHDLVCLGRFWTRESAAVFADAVNWAQGRVIDAPRERLSLFDQRRQ